MGDEKPDRPDKLTPAQREQYEDRYIPRKLARDEVPRSPDKWREASASWRAEWVAGKAFERGADIIFGLPQAGWRAEVPYTAPTGQQIKVDRYLEHDDRKGGQAHNLEIKKGDLKERDLAQMQGYQAKLDAGEHFTLLMRASKLEGLSPQAKQLIEHFKKTYPEQFVLKAASEKAFQRIFEAGYKAVQKEQAQKLEQNLGKLAAREANGLSIEQIAKDYLRDIEKARELGQPLGIDQMRFMNEALRDMDLAQSRIDLDRAKEDREALGLRYHESRDVEKYLELQARDKAYERAASIDPITSELIDREREEVGKAAQEVGERILDAREQGVDLDLDRLRQDGLALGNALGAVQKMERDMHDAAAKAEIERGMPEKDARAWVYALDLRQEQQDRDAQRLIDAIAATAREESDKARQDGPEAAQAQREAERAQREAEQQRAVHQRDMDRLPPEVANLLDLSQGEAPSAAVARPPDEDTPRVQRGYGYGGPEREREQRRDR
ncbi:hypothetical protein [Nocardia niwae]|uniref:hypothetical protein n=1 Tax=Nocardia niwae TaxID=626084 RepID=UPI0007A3FB63|nr:hypothetical protein [Nocardia niwae]